MFKSLSELFDDVYSAANEIELAAHPLAGSRRSTDAWIEFNDAMNALGEFIQTKPNIARECDEEFKREVEERIGSSLHDSSITVHAIYNCAFSVNGKVVDGEDRRLEHFNKAIELSEPCIVASSPTAGLYVITTRDVMWPKKERDILRFDLIWRDGGYYVSLPQIPSMEVVDARDYDELLRKYTEAVNEHAT